MTYPSSRKKHEVYPHYPEFHIERMLAIIGETAWPLERATSDSCFAFTSLRFPRIWACLGDLAGSTAIAQSYPLGRPVQRLTLFLNKTRSIFEAVALCTFVLHVCASFWSSFLFFETKFFSITRWRVWLDQKSTPSLYSKTPSYIRRQYVRLFIFPKP